MVEEKTKKTKEELAAEEAAARQQLQAILDASRPKHLGRFASVVETRDQFFRVQARAIFLSKGLTLPNFSRRIRRGVWSVECW